jgi:hypothetical protein
MARKSKISPYLHLLGRIPDQQIAKMAGLSQSASVQAQRKKLKINSFRENFIKIEKALKKMKKNVLDEDAAKSLDVPVELFTAVRHYEDLIKNPQAVSKKYKIDKHVLQAMLDKSTHKKSGRKKKSESTKVSIKKPITKKSSTKKEKVKKSSAKKETAKKSSAKKEKVKKSSAKKETAKKSSTKKETAKKSSTKKETAKKSSTKKETAKKSSAKKEAKVKRKYTKRQPVQKSVFLQAYECTFTSGEDFMSIFVNASTFAEAAAKVESIQTDKSIKGRLSAIRNIGIAVQ